MKRISPLLLVACLSTGIGITSWAQAPATQAEETTTEETGKTDAQYEAELKKLRPAVLTEIQAYQAVLVDYSEESSKAKAQMARVAQAAEPYLTLLTQWLEERRAEEQTMQNDGIREDSPLLKAQREKIASIEARLHGCSATNPPTTWKDLEVIFGVVAPGKIAGEQLIKVADGITYKFRWCPAGKFMMGGTEKSDEGPIHEVTLTQGFWMLETEVTQQMWEKVMGTNPSDHNGAFYPVENVSWYACCAFCLKLGERLGVKLQLPTEAQWEYACRAGTTGDYAGNAYQMAWYHENSGKEFYNPVREEYKIISNKSHTVGTKQPNAWGLYDMHGNVQEWCSDYYGDYPKTPTVDPTGPKSGTCRVFRGGCYRDNAYKDDEKSYWKYISPATRPTCRSAARRKYSEDAEVDNLGFRPVFLP